MKRNFLLLVVAALGSMTNASAQVKAFVGARIIDGTGAAPINDGTLIVADGRVKAVGPSNRVQVPAGAERIDVKGKTIIPGLINAHGHVGETIGLNQSAQNYTEENLRRQLGLNARYGITTVFSLGGDGEAGVKMRDSQDTPTLKHARLYVAGPVITGNTPDQARAMVDKVAAMKPDLIKIRVDDNLGATTKMTPDVYKAVIEQARKHNLWVAAHIFYLADAKDLLNSGVGLIAHSIRDKEVDNETIALLKSKNVCVCPTLTREVSTFVYESRPAFFDDAFFLKEADKTVLAQLQEPKRMEAMRNSKSAQQYKVALEMASRNMKKLLDSGVKIAMGTDSGPPARFQGYFEHMELELMAKAGLTPAQIIKAATSDAAACMKMAGKIGSLQPGAWADLVVLDRNPLDDIKNTRSIQSVWIAGNKL